MQLLRVHPVPIVREGQADVVVDDGFVDPDLLGAHIWIVGVIWGQAKQRGRLKTKTQLSANTV